MPRELVGRSCPRYSSIAAFYTADRRRVASKESDIGLWWRETADGPPHRAAWVRDTGELYLARLGSADEGGGEVEVLAVVPDRGLLEKVIEGWRERCGMPGSLSWLRERAAHLGRCARTAQVRMASTLAVDLA